MRYKEAYELVDAALLNANLEFPVLEATKSFIFDNKVQEVGLRTVKKHNTETFSTTGGRAFTFTNPDITTQVYKVELGDKNVPFVPEGGTNSNAANDDIDQIGFYLKNETVSEGTISAATAANPIVVTSASHGLETGDFVFIDNIAGLISATGSKSEVNDKRHRVTYQAANTFSIPIDGSGYAVSYSSGGTWIKKGLRLYFTKDADTGGTITVYYYASPSPKDTNLDTVDLPDQLIPSVVHYTIGELLSYNGNLQRASGHMGLAQKIEDNYVVTHRAREAMPDILRLPLQDFINAR